ncbi:MAG TPA: RNA methyltransferase [Gemmatimonadaceae bacterium]|nr:RNA methyltransferase [Gemmatimonadaceae bacterium]
MRLLTLARDLRRRRARERQGYFVVEGIRANEELLRARLDIVGVLTAPQLAGTTRGQQLHAALNERGFERQEVTEREFASAAETESPQGVLAVVRIPARGLSDLTQRSTLRLVVLDAVQDPGNAGTIIRTAAALGATATIALPGTVDVWNAKVVRSAMGAHFHHLTFHTTWDELRTFLAAEGCELWGSDSQGDSLPPSAPAKVALAVGNEGSGLTPALREAAERVVSIPLDAAVESLNVAVATGILLHELRTSA